MESTERYSRDDLAGALFDELTQGWRNVLLIRAGSGLGKTDLLDRFTVRAVASGYTPLRAAAKYAERGYAFGLVTQWFDDLAAATGAGHGIARLLDTAAVAASRALADGNPDDPAAVRLLQKLYLELADGARPGPLFLQVDDAHRADSASLRFLQHVVRRMPGTPLRLALVDNVDVDWPMPGFHNELLHHRHVRRHGLTPLSESEIAEFVRRYAPPRPAPGLAADYRHLSGGNPALLRALAEDHDHHGRPHRDGYGRTVLRCLRRGDPLALRAVQAAAVLADDASPHAVVQVLDAPPDELGRSLANASATGLLLDGRPRHPAAVEAILDDLSPADRKSLNRRAAAARRRPAPAVDLAPAVDRLQTALAASEPYGARAELRSELAQLESVISPRAAARHLSALIAAAGLGHLTAGHRMALVRHLLWHGRNAEARTVIVALRADGPAPDAAAFEQWLRCTSPGLAAVHVPAPTGRGDAGSWLSRVGALSYRLVDGDRAGAAGLAGAILDDLDPGHGGVWAQEAALLAFAALNRADRAAAVTAAYDRLLEDGVVQQSPAWQALLAGARAEAELRVGNLAVAVDHAQVALTHLTRRSWGVVVGQPLGVLVTALSRAGEFEQAAQWLALPVANALATSCWGLDYLSARAYHRLDTGNVKAALDDFRVCGRLHDRWGLDEFPLAPWRVGAAEACLKLGAIQEAHRLLAEQRTHGRNARFEAHALRLQAETTSGAPAVAHLTRALELFEAGGDRYEQARTLAQLSRAHQASDETARARLAVRRAWHLATTCEAAPLLQYLLAAKAGESPVTPKQAEPPEAADLTGSERRVACLAVLGYTNREIAEKLFITPSTVEQHLTRLYRKLDVSNRRDLPSWLTVEMAAMA
jgi:DNA-binding CsgD family transcriptional regulator